MKTKFNLVTANGQNSKSVLRIHDSLFGNPPFLRVDNGEVDVFIKDDELEILAVNILKALESKYLVKQKKVKRIPFKPSI